MKKKSANQEVNPQGIKVRKCCASCKFKFLYGTDGVRFCTKRNKEVKKFGLCKQWEMREDLQKARYTDGKVKSRAYLRSVLDARLRVLTQIEKGELEPDQVVDFTSLKKEYKENEIFIIH